MLAASAAFFAATAPINHLLIFTLGWGLDGSAAAAVGAELVYACALLAMCVAHNARQVPAERWWRGWQAAALAGWGPFARLSVAATAMIVADWWAGRAAARLPKCLGRGRGSRQGWLGNAWGVSLQPARPSTQSHSWAYPFQLRNALQVALRHFDALGRWVTCGDAPICIAADVAAAACTWRIFCRAEVLCCGHGCRPAAKPRIGAGYLWCAVPSADADLYAALR